MIGAGSVQWRTLIQSKAVGHLVPTGKRGFQFFGNETTVNGMNRRPQMQNTINDAVAAQGMNPDIDSSMVVKRQSSRIVIKNTSNATAIVQLLTLQFKKSLPPDTLVNNLINLGFANIGLPNSSSQDQGTQLKDNTKFFQFFTIKNSKNFTLQPGQEVSKTMWDNTPKKWSKNRFVLDETDVTRQYEELRGAQMFATIVNGQLCFDGEDTTKIAYSPISLDYLFEHRVQYTVCNTNTKSIQNTVLTGTPADPSTVINENIIATPVFSL
jgi:hypothetical protein